MEKKQCGKDDKLMRKGSFPSQNDAPPQKKRKSCDASGSSNVNQSKNQTRNKSIARMKKKRASAKIPAKKKGSASKITRQKDRAATGKPEKKCAAKKNDKQLDPKLIKAKLKERINSIPQSEKNTIQLKWTSKTISTRDEKIVADKAVVKGYYGPLNAQQMTEIENHIESTQMTLSQAISLRSAYLQQKVMHRHETLRRQAKAVCNEYKKGQTILDLAKKRDQPPMNVFRVILSAMKWTKPKIKKALRDPTQFEERERKEFLAAESMDLVSMVNQDEIHEHSEIFEDLLSAWLDQKGIRFARQKELGTEQKKEFGKTILTPDFLLLDHVFINGTPCHWIDCKAFYGANLQFTIKKTRQQMARYIDHWGSGAIVYLQGFSEAIKIQDCALLNAYGALDIESLSKLEEKICAAKNRVSLTTFNDETKEN